MYMKVLAFVIYLCYKGRISSLSIEEGNLKVFCNQIFKVFKFPSSKKSTNRGLEEE